MATKSKENICSKLSATMYSEALARHGLWLRANLGKLTRLALGNLFSVQCGFRFG